MILCRHIRGRDSLNQSKNTYGSLLTPVIFQKLLPEVRKNITHACGTLSWSLGELMQCLSKEVNILNAGNLLNTPQDLVPTATFLAKSNSRKPKRKIPDLAMQRYRHAYIVREGTLVQTV